MEVQEDFKEWLALLNEHDVEYVIAGAYALSYYGVPRYTGGTTSTNKKTNASLVGKKTWPTWRHLKKDKNLLDRGLQRATMTAAQWEKTSPRSDSIRGPVRIT